MARTPGVRWRQKLVYPEELRRRAIISQSAVSQFEGADDLKLSTLRNYLAQLGARLQLTPAADRSVACTPRSSASLLGTGVAPGRPSPTEGDTTPMTRKHLLTLLTSARWATAPRGTMTQ